MTALITGVMGHAIKASGDRMKCLDAEFSHGQMAVILKVNFFKVSCMDKAFTLGKMVENMRGATK